MIKNPPRRFMTGYRPSVYVRKGLMYGMRQPLDGPLFEKLEHAEWWCIGVMEDHFDRQLCMADARIVPFQGMGGLLSSRPKITEGV